MLYINGSILDEHPTGLGVYTQNMIRHLASLEKPFTVLAPVAIDAVDVSRIGRYVKPRYGKLGGLLRFLWAQCILPFKLKKTDVVYHPFHHLSFLARAKQVITLPDLIVLHYPRVARHQYWYYKLVMPFLLKRAAHVICISENTKRDAVRFFGLRDDQISVIYGGYDEDRFVPEGGDDAVRARYGAHDAYVLIVGVTYEHKNVHTAIKAYGKIKDAAGCKMLIAGGPSPYRRALERLVAENHLEEDVVFLGYVPDADLPALYRHAACFVYPSLYEGFGLPVVEAMACGAPVLCARSSSLPEVAGDAALFFDPADADDLGAQLLRAVNESDVRTRLHEKAKANLQRFSWRRAAQEVGAILEALEPASHT